MVLPKQWTTILRASAKTPVIHEGIKCLY